IPTTTNGNNTFSLDTNFTYKEGVRNIGIIRGNPTAAPPQPTRPSPPAVGPVPPEGQRGMLVAWDPVNQKERWRTPGGGGIGGGTVTTAGNLVLQVINDGRLIAYSADKGEKLLEIQTGLRGGMGPPITYMLDGKQYISLMGGTGTVVNPFGGAGGARGAEPLPPGPGAAPNAAPAPPPVRPKLLTLV